MPGHGSSESQKAPRVVSESSPASLQLAPQGALQVLLDAGLDEPEIGLEVSLGDPLLINGSMAAESSFMSGAIG
jgi:hypothetical protein